MHSRGAAALVIGVLIVVAALFAIVLYFCRARRTKNVSSHRECLDLENLQEMPAVPSLQNLPNILFNSNYVGPPSPSIFHRMTVEPIPIMSDTKAQSVHHRLQVDRRSGA